jgi:hypothetical protein
LGKTKATARQPLVQQYRANSSDSQGKDTTSTSIEYDDTNPDELEQGSAKSLDRLFRNPIFASGISSGADAINQSIETLMESVFYNLMDNRIRWSLTDTSSLAMGFTRDLFTARSGAFVVVDRFGIGPEFSRELYRYHNVPVKLGANQSTDVYDIYLRSDPIRVFDNRNLPWWRTAINNWFGVLPILEGILPPSFNPNEMYDPLKRFESPFTFPLSIDSAEGMEIGAIKSYAISGGVNLGLELADGIPGLKRSESSAANVLDTKIPYTIFRTGEYRINVLKKDHKTLWVGLSNSSRLGHRVESKIGKAYYLLSKTIPLWRGMPANFFPIDFGFEEGVTDLTSRVYSFDLRQEEAKVAFLEAVHGNFAAAQVSALRAKEDNIETGVKFFHNKNEKRFDRAVSTGHSTLVINQKTKRVHSDAEIEITDSSGRFHILEAKEDHDVAKWNILTGRTEQNTTLQAELKVRKVIEDGHTEEDRNMKFEFVAEPNTIDLGFSFTINDKFVETEELARYLEDLSRFSKLEFDDLPEFATREPDLLMQRRRMAALRTDFSRDHLLHVTPTHLGRFEGYASVRLTHSQMSAVAALPREVLWLAFCSAFKITNEETCLSWERSFWSRSLDRVVGLFILPFKLIDYRWRSFDAVQEIEAAVSSLKDFESSETPEGKQSALRRLFATEYPIERVESLLSLSNLPDVPRFVELEAQAKGNAPDEVKEKFTRINGRRFRGEKPFPPPVRYENTKEVESKFDPAYLNFSEAKPRIRKISLYKEPTINYPRNRVMSQAAPILVTKVSVSRLLSTEDNIRVYIRLDQSGRVQLAKLKLFEDVIEIPVASELSTENLDRANFLVNLSGPQSLLANVISEESLASGGEFKLTLAVSSNGLNWSDERYVDFRIVDGKLLKK